MAKAKICVWCRQLWPPPHFMLFSHLIFSPYRKQKIQICLTQYCIDVQYDTHICNVNNVQSTAFDPKRRRKKKDAAHSDGIVSSGICSECDEVPGSCFTQTGEKGAKKRKKIVRVIASTLYSSSLRFCTFKFVFVEEEHRVARLGTQFAHDREEYLIIFLFVHRMNMLNNVFHLWFCARRPHRHKEAARQPTDR